MKLFKSLITTTVAAAMIAGLTAGVPSTMAAPMISGGGASVDAGMVQPAQWHRGPFWWGHGWNRRGPGLGILGGLLIGGAIVAAAVAENRYTDAEMRRCEGLYPSFNPRSGTYIDRFGQVRVCPYLY